MCSCSSQPGGCARGGGARPRGLWAARSPLPAWSCLCMPSACGRTRSARPARPGARCAGEERLQLKWFASAAVLVVATLIPSMVTDSVVVPVLSNVAFLCLWVAIGIAVLKYRLYEIDVVISKAVLYGSLAVFITAVYAGLV